MLVRLMSLVSIYLKGKFPDLEVIRGYELRVAIAEMQKVQEEGLKRLYVLAPIRTGRDTLLSRNNTIQRDIGLTVALLAKTSSFDVKECDPLLDLAETIRKSLWGAKHFIIAQDGYSSANFIRLEDVSAGGPEDETRLFAAVMIPFYRVIHNLDKMGS